MAVIDADDMNLDWLARARPPAFPRATASAFAEWVFEQSTPRRFSFPDPAIRYRRQELGRVAHRDIELFLSSRWVPSVIAGTIHSDWELEFSDDGSEESAPFQAEVLRVGGRALRCRPDVVLRNRLSGARLIIERKTTFVPDASIPEGGWPNVEAQLWCYSWIDAWRGASEVFLVGQLWRRHRGGLQLCHVHSGWRRSNASHHRRCLVWFERYGGEFVSSASGMAAPAFRAIGTDHP